MASASLDGSTALITGGLGTLGMAQASRFCAAGARVVLLDRPDRQAEGKAAAATLDGSARYLGIDLADLDGAEAAVARLDTEQPIDILVTNAALIENRPFDAFSNADFEAQMRINVAAAFALARALAPGMKARGRGKIVTIGSLVLNGRWEGYAPYTASKGAVLGLTRSLQRELGPHGVRVNSVAPGAVVSEAEDRVFADRLADYNAWILENQSIKRRITAADVADVVLFLASPQSDMVAGQTIGVDGGW